MARSEPSRIRLEADLGEVARHHDSLGEVAEPRLGPLAARERERELRVPAAGGEREREATSEPRVDVRHRQATRPARGSTARSPGP